MKRRRREHDESLKVIRLWKHAEAVKALPYLRSLTNSLRDHWLNVQSRQLAEKRLTDLRKPTRHDRIALEQAHKDARAAEESFDDALEEMMSLDIFLLDPIQGIALIPFQQGEELAWYVFDLFDKRGLNSWRYHRDPLEKRRDVDGTEGKAEGPQLAVTVEG